jgi:hypothetical protein
MKKKTKKKRSKTSRRPVAEFAAAIDTRSRVEGIIRGYGMVPVVNGSTIVGPAVPSMAHFIGDVNRSFGKDYGPDTLKGEWDVDVTANFIDKH